MPVPPPEVIPPRSPRLSNGSARWSVTKDVLTHHGQKLFHFTDLNGYVVGVTQRQSW
ncbi:hypothetical protein ACGF4C_01280 [Streptomyces sp. NPDC048197]|uniref:hypothetical protein n=1 Tax=Streptomyces sp. NPDC048197 TaxID=3365511 RepID=UPI003711C664